MEGRDTFARAIAFLGLIAALGSTVFAGLSWHQTDLVQKQSIEDRQLTTLLQAQRLLDEAYDSMGGAPGTTILAMNVEPLPPEEQPRFEIAHRKINEATKLCPTYYHCYDLLGIYWVRQMELDKAASAFSKAIELDNKQALPLAKLGLVQLHQGKTDVAIENLKAATAIDPSDARVWVNLGYGYQKSGQSALAQEAIKTAKRIADRRGIALPIKADVQQAVYQEAPKRAQPIITTDLVSANEARWTKEQQSTTILFTKTSGAQLVRRALRNSRSRQVWCDDKNRQGEQPSKSVHPNDVAAVRSAFRQHLLQS